MTAISLANIVTVKDVQALADDPEWNYSNDAASWPDPFSKDDLDLAQRMRGGPG